MTSLTQHQAVGDAAAKIAKLALHKETVSNLVAGRSARPDPLATGANMCTVGCATSYCSVYTCKPCNPTRGKTCNKQCAP